MMDLMQEEECEHRVYGIRALPAFNRRPIYLACERHRLAPISGTFLVSELGTGLVEPVITPEVVAHHGLEVIVEGGHGSLLHRGRRRRCVRLLRSPAVADNFRTLAVQRRRV